MQSAKHELRGGAASQGLEEEVRVMWSNCRTQKGKCSPRTLRGKVTSQKIRRRRMSRMVKWSDSYAEVQTMWMEWPTEEGLVKGQDRGYV